MANMCMIVKVTADLCVTRAEVRYKQRMKIQFSSVQFIDSMPQLNDRMTKQICRQWKRTKRHQSALTIALKLGLEKH